VEAFDKLGGGKMDNGTQEFLMSRILPGTQNAYYDKKNVDFHRNEYAKLGFFASSVAAKTADQLIDLTELEKYLNGGWIFATKIGDHTLVARAMDVRGKGERRKSSSQKGARDSGKSFSV